MMYQDVNVEGLETYELPGQGQLIKYPVLFDHKNLLPKDAFIARVSALVPTMLLLAPLQAHSGKLLFFLIPL